MCYNGLGRRSFLNHVCFFRISAHFKMSYRMTTTRIMYGFIVKKRFGCSVLFFMKWNYQVSMYTLVHVLYMQFDLNQLSISIYNCCIYNYLQERRLGNAKVCTRAKKLCQMLVQCVLHLIGVCFVSDHFTMVSYSETKHLLALLLTLSIFNSC